MDAWGPLSCEGAIKAYKPIEGWGEYIPMPPVEPYSQVFSSDPIFSATYQQAGLFAMGHY